MTLPRTAADVLADHVVFEVECIDRMYLNAYVPQLQRELGVIGYLRGQLGCSINSTAPLAAVTEAFNAAVRRFAAEQQVPLIDFVKGQRKDDVMHEHLARFTGTEGVLFIGRAQEKARVFRTVRRRDSAGKPYPWIVPTTAVINHWYFYCVDADFGPFFLKYVSYFPYNAKLCIFSELSRLPAAAGVLVSSPVSACVLDGVGDQFGVGAVQAGECVTEIDGDSLGQACGEAEHAGFAAGAGQLASVEGVDRLWPVDGRGRGVVDQVGGGAREVEEVLPPQP
jgi:hypothetical protein